jgi:hypothetical protein
MYTIAVIIVLSILVIAAAARRRPIPHITPAQYAACYILKDIKSLAVGKVSMPLVKSAAYMCLRFGSAVPTPIEADTLYHALSGSETHMLAAASALDAAGFKISNGHCAAVVTAGWVHQTASTLRSLVGLIRVLGNELHDR